MANIGVAAYNFDNLAIKAIMKTSEQTAKVMVKSPDENEVKETTERHPQEKTNGNDVQKKDEKK